MQLINLSKKGNGIFMKKIKLKRYLNLYNLAILCCTIIVVLSLYFFLRPEENKIITPSGIEVVDTKIKEDEEISEAKAKEAAIKQFKKLGEKANKDELTVKQIKRSGEKYYYITSKQNTMEIKIKGGKITRINSAPVEE